MKIHNGRFLREAELRDLGVGAVGENVAVHESCVLVDLAAMRLGSNVRIDAFSVLSAAGGWLHVGDFVHVSSHCSVMAGSGVELADFSGLSAGVRIFSRSDDYTGAHLTNPTVPAAHTAPPAAGPVRLGRHVILGAGVVVLPQVEIGEGCSVGAHALVSRSLAPWGIYAGAPARRVRDRARDLLGAEARLRAALAAGEIALPVAHL